MDMLKVKEINKSYMLKVKEENYENDVTMDICNASSALIYLEPLVGSDADKDTFGEFTRRFNDRMRELEELLKS